MLRSGQLREELSRAANQLTASHDCYPGCMHAKSWLGQRGWNRGILPAGRVEFRSASYQVSTPRRADQDLTLQCLLVGGSHPSSASVLFLGRPGSKISGCIHSRICTQVSGEQQTPKSQLHRATLHTWQPSLPLGPNSVGGWQDWRCCWREELVFLRKPLHATFFSLHQLPPTRSSVRLVPLLVVAPCDVLPARPRTPSQFHSSRRSVERPGGSDGKQRARV